MTEINPDPVPDEVVNIVTSDSGFGAADQATWQEQWAPFGEKVCHGGPFDGSTAVCSGPIGKRALRIDGARGVVGYYRLTADALEWDPA